MADGTALKFPNLSHIDHWVFDLDNTLYPSSCDLFSQVDVKIGTFISEALNLPYEEARKIQKDYFREYGTSMRGMMDQFGTDPDEFLEYVHDIDHSPIPHSPELDSALAALPGEKYVFTNGSVGHAEKVLDRLGVTHHFDGALFDIAAADYHPKPNDVFYDRFISDHKIDPGRSILFEDMAKNLKPAHERGMTTVLVVTENDYAMEGHDGPHVQHRTDDLVAWLKLAQGSLS